MNVTCPNCATTYRVDPAKVPEGGVRARCAVCGAVFGVHRDDAAREAEPLGVRPPSVAAAPPPVDRAHSPAPPAPPAAPAAPVTERSAAAAPAEAFLPQSAPAPAARAPVAAPAPSPSPRPPRVSPAARPTESPPRPATPRPVNPFLSQDPTLKARRLARALISDMVVYHPAKRKEGLRNNTLKSLFEEEIKKSWEEYVDQVGKDVADTTPFFREALNDILAEGQTLF